MKKELLTQAELKELLHYDPDTGIFTWLGSGSGRKMGAVGSLSQFGYRKVELKGVCYLAHRLAFLYMTGDWPIEEIDHINRVKDDNRWGNLRLATSQQNKCNKGLQSNNQSGVPGVRWNDKAKKWKVQIRHNRKQLHLGLFSSKEQAAKVYENHARKLHGEFANVGEEQ